MDKLKINLSKSQVIFYCDKKKGKNLAYNWFNFDICPESRHGNDAQKLQLPLV